MISALQRQLLRHLFMTATFLFFFQIARAVRNEPAPVLRLASGSVSKDGHVRIVWEVSGVGAAVELQQAQSENFQVVKTVYRGHDQATFVSGLENGTYYYRIRQVDHAWSEPVKLTVRHHSLGLALILFSLGAIVFALTVFVVVKGALHAPVD